MYKKIIFLCLLSATFSKLEAQSHFVLNSDNYKKYIDQFNKDDVELYKGYFPNDSAWAFIEVINPYTGDWISRTVLKERGWQKNNGGEERGKDYNHSSFCDLVITGLIGLRPQNGDTVNINPLIPASAWDWFCLDNIAYHGKVLTIVYDRFGSKYGKGKGLMCFVNGELRIKSENIQPIAIRI